MINVTTDKLETATLDAFDRATASPKDARRWQNAIARAWKEFQTNPYLDWQDDALLILSPSNEIYRANGTCQCKAFTLGQPCWHRAAARIVQRCLTTSH
jgi:hypothetical protein